MGIGEHLKRIRELNNLSVRKLAEYIGVDAERMRKWESQGVNPRDEDKSKIENYFGISVLDLHKVKIIDTSKIIPIKVIDKKTIPYYPDVNASAGLNFLTENGNNYNVPISIPNVDAEAFINVFGDSMYPKFCSGEIIGIKKIENDFVMFGQAYVVQMKDGEAYLKYIKKGKDDKHWILASENEQYEPKEFSLSKIDKVFIIKAVISKTTLL